MFVDSHCHLDFERFAADRDEVVERATAVGVSRIIVPAVDLDNCQQVLALADQYAGVYAAVGVHPNSTAAWQDHWLDQLRSLAIHPKVVAIGEIGLDYYWDKSPKVVQQQAFVAQLALAAEMDLPVIVHNRDADEDVLRLLAESPLTGRDRPGVLHSFLSDWQTAQSALDLGYYLGFTGPLTYPKSESLRAVVAQMPLDRLLIETDAPFLAPQTQRGKRNEPAFVVQVAEMVAEVRKLKLTMLAMVLTENVGCLFGRNVVQG